MPSLQVLYQSGAVLHLLIVCLLLGTAYGQDNRNDPLSLNMNISPIKTANGFTVQVTVTNNMDKCMVVKVSTEDNPSIKYLSAHAAYTACVCSTNNFFWTVQASANAVLQARTEVILDEDICPEGEELYPETGRVWTFSREILVTP